MGLGVLKHFQYAPRPLEVTEEARYSLLSLAGLILAAPPRRVHLLSPPRTHLVCYSDASWEPDVQPRLGWIIFSPTETRAVMGASSLVSYQLLDHLVQRKTQIMACEGIAVPQAMLRNRGIFRNADVTWYIDNEAACSSLVRRGSSHEDISLIAGATHPIMMELPPGMV